MRAARWSAVLVDERGIEVVVFEHRRALEETASYLSNWTQPMALGHRASLGA